MSELHALSQLRATITRAGQVEPVAMNGDLTIQIAPLPSSVQVQAPVETAPDTGITLPVSASWGELPLIEGPIMNLWRRRPYDSDTLMRDALILLAPIALTCASLLWFFG